MMNGDPATHGSTLDYYLNSQVEEVVAAAVSKHPLAAYTAILLTQVSLLKRFSCISFCRLGILYLRYWSAVFLSFV